MQATVLTFDESTREGAVVTDAGVRHSFDPDVFDASGLRLLRKGQRLRVELKGDRVVALTIVTLPPAAPII